MTRATSTSLVQSGEATCLVAISINGTFLAAPTKGKLANTFAATLPVVGAFPSSSVLVVEDAMITSPSPKEGVAAGGSAGLSHNWDTSEGFGFSFTTAQYDDISQAQALFTSLGGPGSKAQVANANVYMAFSLGATTGATQGGGDQIPIGPVVFHLAVSLLIENLANNLRISIDTSNAMPMPKVFGVTFYKDKTGGALASVAGQSAMFGVDSQGNIGVIQTIPAGITHP